MATKKNENTLFPYTTSSVLFEHNGVISWQPGFVALKMASYVTFYDRKPSGPESCPILSPVQDVVFDL